MIRTVNPIYQYIMKHRMFLQYFISLIFLLLAPLRLAGADEMDLVENDLTRTGPQKQNVVLTGQGGVSATGAFSYSLPIEIPAGRMALQPDLSLAYNSDKKNGLLGVGWSITGFPVITRMAWTDPVDFQGGECEAAQAGGVCDPDTYAFVSGGWETSPTPDDRLVFDKVRQRYVTKKRSAAEFEAVGTSCGQGPCYWILRDGKGTTYYFGGDEDTDDYWNETMDPTTGLGITSFNTLWEPSNGVNGGRGIKVWFIRKIVDRHGNYVVFQYQGDDIMRWPKRILYTMHDDDPGCQYRYAGGSWDRRLTSCRSITFDYTAARSDTPRMPHRFDRLLKNIVVTSRGSTVRHYRLNYANGQRSGNSLLASVEEFGIDDLPAPVKMFQYAEGEYQPRNLNTLDGFIGGLPAHSEPLIVYHQRTRVSEWTTHTGDINGDGKDDLVRVYQGASGRKVQFALGGVLSFSPVITIDDTDDDLIARPFIRRRDGVAVWHSFLGDMNGDGIADLVLPLTTPTKFEVWYALGLPSVGIETRTDVTGRRRLNLRQGLASTPTSQHPWNNKSILTIEKALNVLAGDINGDEMLDIVVVDREHHDVRAALGGDPNFGFTELPPSPAWNQAWSAGACRDGNKFRGAYLRDINGDQRDDLVLAWSGWITATNCPSGQLTLAYAYGRKDPSQGIFTTVHERYQDHITHPTMPRFPNHDFLMGDTNGDGRSDAFFSYQGYMNRSASTPGGTIPFSRDLRSVPGPWVPSNNFILNDVALEAVELPYQELDKNAIRDPAKTHMARVRPYLADINGDGIDDSINVYRGQFGIKIHTYLGTPDGTFGPRILHQAYDPSIDPNTPHFDGWVNLQRWVSTFADLNGDGKSDLVMAYYGPNGTKIQYALGTNQGLGTLQWLAYGTASTEGWDKDIKVLTPDINGDGKRDIVIVNDNLNLTNPDHRTVQYIVSNDNGEIPDLLTKIQNGIGESTTIDYFSAVRHTNGIYPGRRPDYAGIADTRPRYLVQSVAKDNGQSGASNKSSVKYYSYRNGRRMPGTLWGGQLAVSNAVPGYVRPTVRDPLAERNFLGFQVVTETDSGTLARTETTYHQNYPLAGQPSVQKTFVWKSLNNVSGHSEVRRKTFTWDYETPLGQRLQGDVVWTRLTSITSEEIEGPQTVRARQETYVYDNYGNVIEEARGADENKDGQFTDTEFIITKTYHNFPDTSPSVYLVSRIGESIKYRIGACISDDLLILDHRLYDYDTRIGRQFDFVRERRAFMQEAETFCCRDPGDPNERISCAGTTSRGQIIRWVPVRQNQRYNSFGHLIYTEDARGHATEYTFDPIFKTYPASVKDIVNGARHITTRTYDDAGQIITESDVNNQTTSYEYDGLGRLVKIIRPGDPSSGSTQISYLNFGDLTKQRVRTELYNSSLVKLAREDHFDGYGEIIQSVEFSDAPFIGTSPGLTPITVRHEIQVDSQSKVKVIRKSKPFLPQETQRYVESVYDGIGRLLKTRRVVRVHNTYQVEKQLTRIYYNPNGNVTIEDAEGRRSTTDVNAWGLISRFSDAKNQETVYEYDRANRMARVILPQGVTGNQIQYLYDSWGRERSIEDDATGLTSYAYDDLNNLLKTSNSLGQTNLYTYDALNRLKTEKNSLGLVVYEYDNVSSPHSMGRLSFVTYPSGRKEFSYDVRGRISSKVVEIDGLSGRHGFYYAYDWQGRIKETIFPDGQRRKNYYANDGPLKKVTLDGQTLATYRNFDASRRIGQRSLQGGTVTNYTYNQDEGLSTLETQGLDGNALIELQKYDYHYDRVGNVTQIRDNRALSNKITQGINTDDSQNFTYDALNRLISAHGSYGHRTYDYDALGNITQKDGVVYTYAQQLSNRTIHASLSSGRPSWRVAHDRAGNRLSFGRDSEHDGVYEEKWSYQYDSQSRLISVSRNGTRYAKFVYDENGKRIRKTIVVAPGAKVESYYLGDGYEIRVNSLAPHQMAVSKHIRGIATVTGGTIIGQPSVADVIAQGEGPIVGDTIQGMPGGTWFHHDNHIRSCSVTTDTNARDVMRLLYDPFGRLVRSNSTGTDIHTRKFTGQELDEATGLMYYGARYYDPLSGRFITADTLTPGDGRNPQGFNRFSYVLNNPVKFTDPTGHIPLAGLRPDFDSVPIVPSNDRYVDMRDGMRIYGTWLTGVAQAAGDWAFENLGGSSLVSTNVSTGIEFAGQMVMLGPNMVMLPEYLVSIPGRAEKNAEDIDIGIQTGNNRRFWRGVTGVIGDSSTVLSLGRGRGTAMSRSTRTVPKLNVVKKLNKRSLKGPPKERGSAPIGKDGHPVELHHKNQRGNKAVEMTRTEHRGKGNFKKNHKNTGQKKSKIDRDIFNKQKKEYWSHEWDRGRFDDL